MVAVAVVVGGELLMIDTHRPHEDRDQSALAFDLLQADRVRQRAANASIVMSKIKEASPLAFDLVDAVGYHLPDLLTAFGPSSSVANDNEAANHTQRLNGSLASIAYATGSPFADVLRDHRFLQLHREWGMVLRLPSDTAGRFGVQVAGGLVHVRSMLGEATVHLIGGRATLIGDIGSDICIADVKDQCIDALIDHPLLVGRAYPVLGIVPLVATSIAAVGRQCVMIVFDTGLVPLWTGAGR